MLIFSMFGRHLLETPEEVTAVHTGIAQEGAAEDEMDQYAALTAGETLYKLASGYPARFPAVISLQLVLVPPLLRLYDDNSYTPEDTIAPLLVPLVGGSDPSHSPKLWMGVCRVQRSNL